MRIDKRTVEKPRCSHLRAVNRKLKDYLELLAWLAAFILSAITFPYHLWAMTGRQSADVRMLIAGAPIERELAGGQSHSYRLALSAGQIAKFEVEPREIALVVEVIDPDGAKAMSEVREKLQGEMALLIAEKSGEYRVTITAAEMSAQAGRYKITLVEIRLAERRDRDILAAERVMKEA